MEEYSNNLNWSKEAKENWDMKMKNFRPVLLSEEETERLNEEHSMPTEEEIKKIMEEYNR